ncbi:MAG: hypothetical protein JW965_01175, partial [Bacteroidales bacterium]|nr:hypothetical protein [Bacteroidales bacterium]
KSTKEKVQRKKYKGKSTKEKSRDALPACLKEFSRKITKISNCRDALPARLKKLNSKITMIPNYKDARPCASALA